MSLKSFFAVVTMLGSATAFAQVPEASPTREKKEKPCRDTAFMCAYKAEIEKQKSEPQPPLEPVQTGFMTVNLSIDEQGSVDKCDVLKTNAPPALTDKFCSIFVTKAKFKPKLDEHGVAQRDTFTQTVKFKIEN